MAKNTGRGARATRTDAQAQTNGSSAGPWKRNLPTGRFAEAKKAGGTFKSRRSG